jgi:hypothetical protein
VTEVPQAVAIATPNGESLSLDEIDILEDWGEQMGNHYKIPSAILYMSLKGGGEEQWGSSFTMDA